jgi:hypothetical protein
MDFFKGLDIEKVANAVVASTSALEEFPTKNAGPNHQDASRLLVTSTGDYRGGLHPTEACQLGYLDQTLLNLSSHPANAAVGKARNVLAAWEELDFEVGMQNCIHCFSCLPQHQHQH